MAENIKTEAVGHNWLQDTAHWTGNKSLDNKRYWDWEDSLA